ncbi:MAG: DoxX family protein [Myxococcota bacterium]|jgi:uncharacterized membrane protein|nr:DoxX family protein [Myxococcota bacterium]
MAWLPASIPQRIVLVLVALQFTYVGVSHFTNPDFFVAIMPPCLPAHLELVYLSGVFEVLGGVGVLVPMTRRFAGWGLLALLVAVYPANIHMAMNPEQFPDMSPGALYARLPIQFVFAALVWYAMRPDASRVTDS